MCRFDVPVLDLMRMCMRMVLYDDVHVYVKGLEGGRSGYGAMGALR